MDRESRLKLRRVVTEARAFLEEDVKTQLKRLGIEEGGTAIPAGRLVHLRLEDKELRERLLAAIGKEQAKKIERGEAYDRYVRHVGFTYLNRLAALRAMEVRGLLEKETVIRRGHYSGLSERAYEISEREGLTDVVEINRRSLLDAFSEVSQEIKVLFDVSDEYSLLFPSCLILDNVIQLLSLEVPEDDWREENVIGWIYQYYNSAAREELRKRRRKLRADDVPVANQFYTSRWLVRALVDNTLGRLWLEMRGRLPKPGIAKAPSAEHLKSPYGETVDEYCSYLIPPRHDAPARERKAVRDIRVIDPACGSGHFLVYAFNVLYRMYLEDEPQTPKEEIPRLVLENNLFGIDIDLRSVQLAALSLFLKAKEYNPKVKIGKMNLVCADVRITNGDLKKAFLRRLEPDVDLQRIFTKLFDELDYTYDVGSLLKVREPFERLFRERSLAQARFQVRPKGQISFLGSSLVAQTSMSVGRENESVVVRPAVTLRQMLEALVSFESEGIEKKDMGTMLFAVEAEKSVGLLTLLSQKYDVIVMNPPYGDMPDSTKEYARKHYPRTHYDYYAAFIEQAVDLSEENGFVGMLTGRTFMFLRSYEEVRTAILLKEARSELVFDLNSSPGDNILDEATGRWAATVARKLREKNDNTECIFVRLTLFEGEDVKIDALENAVSSWLSEGQNGLLYPVKLGALNKLPRMPYSYWVPEGLAKLFEKYPPLDRDNAERPDQPKIADLRVGLSTGDDDRFTRYWWEVDTDGIALSREETLKGKKWVPYLKGGDAYYSDIPLVVNWQNDGEEIKCLAESIVRNENYHFRSGLCWSCITSSILIDLRVLPKGCISSANALTLFPAVEIRPYSLLGLLNSSLLAMCFQMLNPTMHDRAIGYICQLPIASEALVNVDISDLSAEILSLKRDWNAGDEPSPDFVKPWILQFLPHNESEKPVTRHPLACEVIWSDSNIADELNDVPALPNMSIRELANLCVEEEKTLKERLSINEELIDDRIYNIYGIDEENRNLVERELRILRGFPKALKKDRAEAIMTTITVKEHITRLLSHYVKLAIEDDADGIMTLDQLVQQMKIRLISDFGAVWSEKAESEIRSILGKSLKEWLAEDFSNFHVGLYERRPVVWQLTSTYFSARSAISGSFNCFLYYHKIGKDTIPKIRTRQEYLKGILDSAKWKTERLRRELQEVGDSQDSKRVRQLQAEYEEAQDEYTELQAFDQKLAEVSNSRDETTELDDDASWVERKIGEVRDSGWNPVLDYGVRVNIEPLKEARLLHPAADRVK